MKNKSHTSKRERDPKNPTSPASQGGKSGADRSHQDSKFSKFSKSPSSAPAAPKPAAKTGQPAAAGATPRSSRPADQVKERSHRPDHAFSDKPYGKKAAEPKAASGAGEERNPADTKAAARAPERAPKGYFGKTAAPSTPQTTGAPSRQRRSEPSEKAGTEHAKKTRPARPSRPERGEGKVQHRPERGGVEAQKPRLHSGQTVELTITSTNEDGFGVANHEGTRVLVAGGLQGEVLVARITYVGRREAFANNLKCLKASPDREPAPACRLRACDGCALMQMRYPAQLKWKTDLVAREIRKYASLGEVKIHDAIASPKQLHYRNTAKLVVAGKHSDPVIGLYKRNTHDVLEIGDCALHHPLINKVVKVAKAGIKKGKVPIYNPKSEMGLLRYLVVRVAEPSDKVMVVLVTSDEAYNEMHHLAKYIQKEVPEVLVVAQNINTSTGNVIFGQKERFITKAQTLRAYVGDKTFNLSPHSFFQVNAGAAQIIYEKVRDFAALTGSERVLDVYCGIGGISLYLADKAEEVVGIEFVETAVADATQNAMLNRAKNCTFEAGDAARLIDEIGEEGGADLIVLNPPRKGCEEKVLRSVAAIKPAKIVYVSCSPETLSRDLDVLSRLGYRTLEVQPVDMFPQTVHVEDVALLERVKN